MYIRSLDEKYKLWSYHSLNYEDSLTGENLIIDTSVNVEDEAIKNILIDKLHSCLKLLDDNELYLIKQRIEFGRSEREIAKKLGISHTAVGKRLDKLFLKLKKMMEV